MDKVYEPAIHFNHVDFQIGDSKIIKKLLDPFQREKSQHSLDHLARARQLYSKCATA